MTMIMTTTITRKLRSTLCAVTAFLALAFLSACSGGSSNNPPPPPVVAISATSGSGQSAQFSAAFAAPLVATVTTGGTATSGASVTFTAPGSGASGTFGNGTATETDTTDANGHATSSTFTANATVGGPYNVTASTAGATSSAHFSLTNTTGAPAAIAATSGTPQSTTVSTAFGAPLAATVTDGGGNPVSGVSVTFTAVPGGTSASGAFATTGTTDVETTDANGLATTSQTLTANATAGAFTVTADFTGDTGSPATFHLSNTAVVATYGFSFYLTGQEAINSTPDAPNYYALAGAVQIDANGNVLGGEQDYNDGIGLTSPTTGDTISGGALVVNSTTGQGVLTLITNNATLGVAGTETFGVQFVNSSHALVMQYDGSATSSGSMDLQTLTTAPSGGFAFTLSGVDSSYHSVAYGGVFSLSGTAMSNGLADFNDAGSSGQATFTGTLTAADSFGRGQITGLGFGGAALAITYYVVNQKVIRIIDMDAADSAIGSAYSQGSSTFTNASLGSSVLSLGSNPFSSSFAAAAQIATSNTSTDPADFAGVGEDDEFDNIFVSALAAPIAGTYSISDTVNAVTYNGYGNLTITGGLGGGNVSVLGIYLTDPTLNLTDPNNPSGGGGALVLDMDLIMAGGTGVLVPQTDSSSASFSGNYAVEWQNHNSFSVCGDCEFDMVAQGSMVASGALSLTGLVSDPFLTLGTPHTTSSANPFSGTPLADLTNHGRFTMLDTNTAPNPLASTIDGSVNTFNLIIYQASGGQLFWMQYEPAQPMVFFGQLQQQGSLTSVQAARRPAPKSQTKRKP